MKFASISISTIVILLLSQSLEAADTNKPENCGIFNSTSQTCIECSSGYSFNRDGKQCLKCPQDCKKCTYDMECLECQTGYFPEDKVCKRCLEGCDDCSARDTCHQCRTDYYLKDGICQKCLSSRCTVCRPDGWCSSCHEDEFVYYGRCVSGLGFIFELILALGTFLIFFTAASITLCCCFCRTCPCYKKRMANSFAYARPQENQETYR